MNSTTGPEPLSTYASSCPWSTTLFEAMRAIVVILEVVVGLVKHNVSLSRIRTGSWPAPLAS